MTSNEEAAPVDHTTNSRWQILQTSEEPIPILLDKVFFNTTTRGINPAQVEVRRFDFRDIFEREKFNGESDFCVFDGRGNISVDRNNRTILDKKPRTSNQTKISWLEENVLPPASHPVYFMESMLCRKATPDEKKRRQNQAKVSISNDWKNYTNLKAYICGAGEDIYKYWYELSADKIRMHVGLYDFDGVSPSPITEIKFERQIIDTVNGNDLVNEASGGVPSKSAIRRGMFRSFLGFQDP